MDAVTTTPPARTFESAVRDLLADELGIKPEEITLDADIVNDLGADSLDVANILMGAEERFFIELPDNLLDGIERPATVRALVSYVAANGGQVRETPKGGW